MAGKNLHLKRMMFSIASLVDLGQEVSSSKELADKMKAALYVVTGLFSIPVASLYAYDEQRKCLKLLSEKGHRNRLRQIARLAVLTEYIREFRANMPHSVTELSKTAFYEHNSGVLAALQVRIFIPLFTKDEFVGALLLGSKIGKAPFRQSDKDILKVIAHQLAITLHNARLFRDLTGKAAENRQLYENMHRIYQDTIQAFAAAIDAKDEYTKDHSFRVACYAVAIARELGWNKNELEGMYVAGLLHDIGKIIIDEKIINKGEALTGSEVIEIKRHPQISYDILSKIKFPWKDVEFLVRHHHERIDGKGYPDSLPAAQLSEGARILALADAFDAMTTDRPYRCKLGLDEVFREMFTCSGTQFDERITNTLFNLLLRELSGEVRNPQILPILGHNVSSMSRAWKPSPNM